MRQKGGDHWDCNIKNSIPWPLLCNIQKILLGIIASSSLSYRELQIKLTSSRKGYYYCENKNEQKCTALSESKSLMKWIILQKNSIEAIIVPSVLSQGWPPCTFLHRKQGSFFNRIAIFFLFSTIWTFLLQVGFLLFIL